MTAEIKKIREIHSLKYVIRIDEYPQGLGYLIFEPHEIRRASIIGFKLHFAKEDKEVLYGFLCPSKVAKELGFHFDREGNLLIKHSTGEIISLGNPHLGGLSPEGFETKDIQGRSLGINAWPAKRRREKRLEYRSLFADPILDDEKGSVVLTGLDFNRDIGFRIYKLVNTSRSQLHERNSLAREILHAFEKVAVIGENNLS